MKICEVYKVESYLQGIPYGMDRMEFHERYGSPMVTNYRGAEALSERGEHIYDVKYSPVRRFTKGHDLFEGGTVYDETFVIFEPKLEDYVHILLDDREEQTKHTISQKYLEKVRKVESERDNLIKENNRLREVNLDRWDREVIWKSYFVLAVACSLGILFL